MTVDINKKYKTRDGRDVVIYRTDAKGSYPVHGCLTYDCSDDSIFSWNSFGCARLDGSESHYDLIEVQSEPPQPNFKELSDRLDNVEIGYMESINKLADKVENLNQRLIDQDKDYDSIKNSIILLEAKLEVIIKAINSFGKSIQ